MTRPIKVNLPVSDLAPLNGAEDTDVLAEARQAIRIAMDECGYREIGCGFGERCADVTVNAGGQNIQIDIRLVD